MTNTPRIPNTFSWDQCCVAADGPTLAYGASETVRELLVLLALSGSPLDRPDELERATAIAFANVCHDLSCGLVAMDYHPFDPQTLDIPPIDHAHHMQALLYWSCELGCSLTSLTEAYAQLGSYPRVEAVKAILQRIATEDAQRRTRPATTQRFEGPGEPLERRLGFA